MLQLVVALQLMAQNPSNQFQPTCAVCSPDVALRSHELCIISANCDMIFSIQQCMDQPCGKSLELVTTVGMISCRSEASSHVNSLLESHMTVVCRSLLTVQNGSMSNSFGIAEKK
jgi:hypothetical protein